MAEQEDPSENQDGGYIPKSGSLAAAGHRVPGGVIGGLAGTPVVPEREIAQIP